MSERSEVFVSVVCVRPIGVVLPAVHENDDQHIVTAVAIAQVADPVGRAIQLRAVFKPAIVVKLKDGDVEGSQFGTFFGSGSSREKPVSLRRIDIDTDRVDRLLHKH